MDSLPPTITLEAPAPRQQAFIVPKDGVYGKEFTMESVEQFDYFPNEGIDLSSFKGKGLLDLRKGLVVKDLLTNDLLKQDRFKNVGKMKVQLAKPGELEEGVGGTFDKTTNTILLAKGTPEQMSQTLYHEIQHALDKKTNTNQIDSIREFYQDSELSHNLRKTEQVTETNDLLQLVEKEMKNGATVSEILDSFDRRISLAKRTDTAESKSYLQRLRMARTLFEKWADEYY